MKARIRALGIYHHITNRHPGEFGQRALLTRQRVEELRRE